MVTIVIDNIVGVSPGRTADSKDWLAVQHLRARAHDQI